jgi:hypothetical protein
MKSKSKVERGQNDAELDIATLFCLMVVECAQAQREKEP